MSAGTVTVSSSRQSSHRVAALARAEGILLWRNRLALLNAVILPAALVGSLKSFGGLGASGAHDFGAMLLTGLTAFALLIAVYYNLVTAMVARREELVLKRLRTGEATDGEILAGTAAPAIAIAWAQIAVAAVAAVAVLGLNPPANAALVPVALILGDCGVRAAGRGHRCGDPHRAAGAGHDDAGTVAAAGVQRPAVPAGDAARAAAMGRGGAAADAGGGTAAARPDGSRRRRSLPRSGRDLQRGRHPGARAHRLDRGGRVGGTTLVPLGTAALGRRDTLEG